MLLRSIIKHVQQQNWFAVCLDFIIVVLGVAVALTGQHWLSERQQQAEMEYSLEALNSDLFYNYMNSKERLAVAKCRAQSFQDIASKLLTDEQQWQGMPRKPDHDLAVALPTLLRSANRTWGSRVWTSGLDRGIFNRMDLEGRIRFDGLFMRSQNAASLQNDIFTLQGRLKVLAVTITITHSERIRYYDILAELDEKSTLLEVIASQMILVIEEIGISVPDDEISEITNSLNMLNDRSLAIYGDCVEPMTFPIFDKYFKMANLAR